MSQEITQFIADLKRQEAAAKTVANYLSDLNCFARWFTQTTGEGFAAANVTPTDIRDYRSYLQTTQGRAPATVNRRLAALRRFFGRAIGAGVTSENPTLSVKGVQSVPQGPRSLEKR